MRSCLLESAVNSRSQEIQHSRNVKSSIYWTIWHFEAWSPGSILAYSTNEPIRSTQYISFIDASKVYVWPILRGRLCTITREFELERAPSWDFGSWSIKTSELRDIVHENSLEKPRVAWGYIGAGKHASGAISLSILDGGVRYWFLSLMDEAPF